MGEVAINNQSVAVKEYQGQRVVTFKDIDCVHQRAEGTARKRFNENRKHFINNEDYFVVRPGDMLMSEKRTLAIPNRGLTLITESGYLMLAKSLTDDLAWDVQRQLVKCYFRTQEEVVAQPLTVNIKAKLYNGKPVLTIKDIVTLTGVPREMINYYLRHYVKDYELGQDYFFLEGDAMKKFKRANAMPKSVSNLLIVTQTGAEKLAKRSLSLEHNVTSMLMNCYVSGHTFEVAEVTMDTHTIKEQVEICQLIANDLKADNVTKANMYEKICKQYGLSHIVQDIIGEAKESEADFMLQMRQKAFDLLAYCDTKTLTEMKELLLRDIMSQGIGKAGEDFMVQYFNTLIKISKEIVA